MASKVRSRGGMSSGEKIRLTIMAGGVVVLVAIVVSSLNLMTGPSQSGEGLSVVDPDATEVLPEFDRAFLADVVDAPDAEDRAYYEPVLGLLDVVDRNSDVFGINGRGITFHRAKAFHEKPAEIRGDYAKVIGRVTKRSSLKITDEGPVTLPSEGAKGPVVFRYELDDGEGGRFTVFSSEAAPEEGGRVLKVLGMFLRIGAAREGEGAGPVEIVAIRLIPSVIPERFEHIDPSWFRLVREASIEEREDLRTPAIFLTLAWARTIGPDGLAERLEAGTLRAEDMPTADEIHEHHDKLKGRLFRVKGELEAIHGDHEVPENRSGLESVYRLEVIHTLGPRKGFPVVALAGIDALPRDLRAGDTVVLEGVYVKIWTTSDRTGTLVLRPLLIAPRVRVADASDTEE